MKIEWVDDSMEEAIITRGWFRRRVAHVKMELNEDRRNARLPYRGAAYGAECSWVFALSRRLVDNDTDAHLFNARKAEIERRWASQDWAPYEGIPAARVVQKR